MESVTDKIYKKYVDQKTEASIKDYIEKKGKPKNGAIIVFKYHRYYVNVENDIIIPQKEFVNVFGPLIELHKRVTLNSNDKNVLIITEANSPHSRLF